MCDSCIGLIIFDPRHPTAMFLGFQWGTMWDFPGAATCSSFIVLKICASAYIYIYMAIIYGKPPKKKQDIVHHYFRSGSSSSFQGSLGIAIADSTRLQDTRGRQRHVPPVICRHVCFPEDTWGKRGEIHNLQIVFRRKAWVFPHRTVRLPRVTGLFLLKFLRRKYHLSLSTETW